jgi:ABC-2 type transport system permease protein
MQTKGWSDVLKFTYIQTIKAKSFVVSTIITIVIFGVMLAGVNFLPGLLSSQPEIIQIIEDGVVVGEFEAFAIEKVYIFDDSGLDIDFSFLQGYEVQYEYITAEQVSATMDRVTDSYDAITLAVIQPDEFGYSAQMSRPQSTELLNNSDCFALLGEFARRISVANLIDIGVAEQDIGKAYAGVFTSVNVAGEEPRSETAAAIAAAISMMTSIVLFVLIISFGQLTAQAIATEKASRVMELLLTSVKPLAVIIGKVLATTLVALSAVAVVGALTAGMFFLVAPFGAIGEATGMIDTTDPIMKSIAAEMSTAFAGFTPVNIALILVIFILGFLFYSLISGLIGASVSKIEDLQTALQPLVYISLLGFYLTYFSSITGIDSDGQGNFLVTLSRYLPISSPFALPSAILTGQISANEIAVAVAVLALSLGLFALFVAKVYEHIILHNGNRVKIKDMIKMAKSK